MRQKAEDFIGWKSKDGNLEVVEIIKKCRHTTYKVHCKICSKDKELFPLGYFVSTKSNLIKGQVPCGCSRHPLLNEQQWLTCANRSAKGFIIHGYAEPYKGQTTKLDCECLIDKHKWSSTLSNIIHKGVGCPKCKANKTSDVFKMPEKDALAKCYEVCEKEGYKPIGFVEEYKTSSKARFEYICPTHGNHIVNYSDFVNQGSKCPSCAKHGYNPNKQGSFYIVKWTNSSDSFIKFGITNRNVIDRLKQQGRRTNYCYKILFKWTWKDGHIPLDIEKSVKSSNLFSWSVIDREDFGDGFTETLETKELDNLTDYVIRYINSLDLVV